MSDIELLQVDHIDWPNAVISAALTAPPGSPTLGDRYIVAGSPTGAWSGHATHIARWNGSAWQFQTPTAGRLAYNEATSGHLRFDGSSWSPFTTSGTLQNAYDAGATIALSSTDLVASDGSDEVLRLGSATKLAAPTQPTANTTGYALTITGSKGGAAASAGVPGDGGTVTITAGVMGSEAASPGSAVGGVAGNHLILRGGDGGNVSGVKSGSAFLDGGQVGTGAAGGTPVPGDVKIGTNANQTYAVRMGQSTTGTPVEVKGPIWTPLTTLTDAATVTVTIAKGNAFKVVLGGNRTLDFSFPTNYSNSTVDITGHTGRIIVQQDATGSRTLAFAAKVKTTGDVSLNSAASAYTVFEFCVETTSIVHLRKVEASSASSGVASFNSRTGVVTPQTGDYTATNVGLGSVTNDAQLNRAAGDFSTFTHKTTPTSTDVLIIEDAAASGAKKYCTISEAIAGVSSGVTTFNGRSGTVTPQTGDYTATNVGLASVTNDAQLKRAASDFSSFATKSTPVTGDIILLEDSAASGVKKAATIGSLAAAVAAGGSSIIVAKAGTDIGTRGRINLIEGSGVTLTVADNSGAGRVDVTVAASGAVSNNPFLDAPASPHADNDEFTAWSGWTVYDITAAAVLTDDGDGSVDPWTFPASGHYRRRTLGSYIMLQFPKSTNVIAVYKAITPASNMLLWSRYASGANFTATGVNSFQTVSFAVFQNSAGRPDINNWTGAMITNPSGTNGRHLASQQQGNAQVNSPASSSGASIPDIAGVFEQSTTSRHIFFADSKSGDFSIDDSSPFTSSRTTAYAGWRVVPSSTSNTNGACPILLIDYFRRKDSSTAWIV